MDWLLQMTKTNKGGTTYIGRLDLLDFQAVFDSIFPCDSILRVPLRVNTTNKEISISRDNGKFDVRKLGEILKFELFIHHVKIHYIGTNDRLNSAVMSSLDKALSRWTMEYRGAGGQIHRSKPETIFQWFLEITPYLGEDTKDWSFNLVFKFKDALTTDIKDRMQLNGYEYPTMGAMTTKTLQLAALQIIRDALSHQQSLFHGTGTLGEASLKNWISQPVAHSHQNIRATSIICRIASLITHGLQWKRYGTK
eukprot:scaffold21162_cov65-Attheya_sp.AAC.1